MPLRFFSVASPSTLSRRMSVAVAVSAAHAGVAAHRSNRVTSNSAPNLFSISFPSSSRRFPQPCLQTKRLSRPAERNVWILGLDLSLQGQ